MALTPLETAKVAAIAADGKKASDLVLIDLTGLSDVCDYFLVMSAGNPRLADALADEVKEKVLANAGLKPLSIEGRAEGNWILIDYGSLVVHIFQPETRDYYRIERLWGDAPRVSLGLESEAGEDAFAWEGDGLASEEEVRGALVQDIDAEDDLFS